MAKLFIAYPFRPEAQRIVDRLILPIASSHGISCVTGARKVRRDENVMESLREAITSCSALVAVVTERNPNVFFELGVASALKKPCVLVASNEDDAVMLQGAYPVVIIEPAYLAMQELGRHLSLWARVSRSSATVRL